MGYARGAAGGLLIGLPLLYTMEMWWHGFYMDPWKLLVFLLFTALLLFVLEYFSGFRDEGSLLEVAKDALVTYGIGVITAATVLFILSVLRPGMPPQEVLGKIILMSIPVSIGASVAISELGQRSGGQERKKRKAGFFGQQLIALSGGVVFGLNIAPTVEPMLIGLRYEWWNALLLMLLSLLLAQAMVIGLNFKGGHEPKDGKSWWRVLLEQGTVSYLVALLLAAFLLWVFGRIGPDTGLTASLHMIVALGFVTALGSAAGRLLI